MFFLGFGEGVVCYVVNSDKDEVPAGCNPFNCDLCRGSGGARKLKEEVNEDQNKLRISRSKDS